MAWLRELFGRRRWNRAGRTVGSHQVLSRGGNFPDLPSAARWSSFCPVISWVGFVWGWITLEAMRGSAVEPQVVGQGH